MTFIFISYDIYFYKYKTIYNKKNEKFDICICRC